MNYWLLKTEPSTYSWDDLVRDKQTDWTGVRNFQARNNLKLIQTGDIAFIYHSGEERSIVGLARIISPPSPDTTADDGDWVAVRIEAIQPMQRTVTLDEVKQTHTLAVMPLVTHSRLSVQPVTAAQAELLLKIGKTSLEEGK